MRLLPYLGYDRCSHVTIILQFCGRYWNIDATFVFRCISFLLLIFLWVALMNLSAHSISGNYRRYWGYFQCSYKFCSSSPPAIINIGEAIMPLYRLQNNFRLRLNKTLITRHSYQHKKIDSSNISQQNYWFEGFQNKKSIGINMH